jgi:hypothetical protein
MAGISLDGEPSLKDGRMARHDERNPRAGVRPFGDCFMQMVPPVMMIKTLDSGLDGELLAVEVILLVILKSTKDQLRMVKDDKIKSTLRKKHTNKLNT